MTSSNKTFAKNTFFLYIMTGAKFVLPLIITACLTRRLGPDAYGVISYLTPVMGYFILLFDFGFNFSALKKPLPRYTPQRSCWCWPVSCR